MSSPHVTPKRFPVGTAVAGLVVGGVIWGLTAGYHVAEISATVQDGSTLTKYSKIPKSWSMKKTMSVIPGAPDGW